MADFPGGLAGILTVIQVFFGIVIGLYFWNLLRAQQGGKVAVRRDCNREFEKLRQLRSISLTEPLAEKTRPQSFEEVIGQEESVKALRAALCGPHPQHVILYGPPGVGKTAAARLILEEAKKNPHSPFKNEAKFVEIDATTARFDERGIADPLIGSVHDPIYQGAGPLGVAGVPQPKPGAVTRAHGGILFLDEIGELHPIQMNKLLKVLEDRRVFLESAYYNQEDPNTPAHIHDIFQNGLPADFRLVGATTRQPDEITPAIRSRCVEIFFRPLTPAEITIIAANAVKRIGLEAEDGALEVATKYATNGREAVNMVQLAGGVAIAEGRLAIRVADMEWVVTCGQYNPRPEGRLPAQPSVGVVAGLAVCGPNVGTVLEIEASAIPAKKGHGRLNVTGVVDEEEFQGTGRRVRRKSSAKSAVENVLTALRYVMGVEPSDYDIHINFPGGIPIDGPSAGVAVATAVYSALTGVPVDNRIALTGELSIRGLVKPVGGIVAKVAAAAQAGAKRVLIPRENHQTVLESFSGIEIIPVDRLEDVIRRVLLRERKIEQSGVEETYARTTLPFSAKATF
ncbi:MAG: ATP-dependent protease LonB [Bacillota bacterium]